MGWMTKKPRRPGIVGQNLRRLRLARGLTQRELAEASGFHEVGIAMVETGARKDPDLATIRKLAKALDVRPRDLVEEASGWTPIDDALASFEKSGFYGIVQPTEDELSWLRSLPGLFWVGAPPSDESIALVIQAYRKSRR